MRVIAFKKWLFAEQLLINDSLGFQVQILFGCLLQFLVVALECIPEAPSFEQPKSHVDGFDVQSRKAGCMGLKDCCPR